MASAQLASARRRDVSFGSRKLTDLNAWTLDGARLHWQDSRNDGDRCSGRPGPFDVRVDLDELVFVAEEAHTQHGRRWHVRVEASRDLTPGVAQVLVVPYDVDGHLVDVIDLEPVQLHDGEQVGEAPLRLGTDVADGGVPIAVERDLAGQEQPITERRRRIGSAASAPALLRARSRSCPRF